MIVSFDPQLVGVVKAQPMPPFLQSGRHCFFKRKIMKRFNATQIDRAITRIEIDYGITPKFLYIRERSLGHADILVLFGIVDELSMIFEFQIIDKIEIKSYNSYYLLDSKGRYKKGDMLWQ